MNLPLTETNSLGTSTTTYDAASQITSITDADGHERDFVHDTLGRLTAENWMQGGTAIASMNYSYDAASELAAAGGPNSSYAFTYNGDGQVASVDNSGTLPWLFAKLQAVEKELGILSSRLQLVRSKVQDVRSMLEYLGGAPPELAAALKKTLAPGLDVNPNEVSFTLDVTLGQLISKKGEVWASLKLNTKISMDINEKVAEVTTSVGAGIVIGNQDGG